jgi:hypothetical protein
VYATIHEHDANYMQIIVSEIVTTKKTTHTHAYDCYVARSVQTTPLAPGSRAGTVHTIRVRRVIAASGQAHTSGYPQRSGASHARVARGARSLQQSYAPLTLLPTQPPSHLPPPRGASHTRDVCAGALPRAQVPLKTPTFPLTHIPSLTHIASRENERSLTTRIGRRRGWQSGASENYASEAPVALARRRERLP